MIVCNCRVVSDREVHGAISRGATDLCGVAEQCDAAGTRCGGCLPEMRRILADKGLPTDVGLTARDVRARLRAVMDGRDATPTRRAVA